MQLLDGKATAEKIRIELKEAVLLRKKEGKKIPHLAAVLVGNDGGSITYVNAKVKACEQIGFESSLIRYDDSVSEEQLLKKIKLKVHLGLQISLHLLEMHMNGMVYYQRSKQTYLMT